MTHVPTSVPGEQLSSGLTIGFKVVIPAIWLCGFVVGTLGLALQGDGQALVFGFFTLLGAVMFGLFCVPLKRVFATEEGLLVSNFRREELIPYDQITNVKELKLVNIRPVVVYLRRPCGFGHKIMFMPYWMLWLMFWKDHPAATLIRARARD